MNTTEPSLLLQPSEFCWRAQGHSCLSPGHFFCLLPSLLGMFHPSLALPWIFPSFPQALGLSLQCCRGIDKPQSSLGTLRSGLPFTGEGGERALPLPSLKSLLTPGAARIDGLWQLLCTPGRDQELRDRRISCPASRRCWHWDLSKGEQQSKRNIRVE